MSAGRKLYDEWSTYWPDRQHRRADRDVLQRRAEVRHLELSGEPGLEQHDGAARRCRRDRRLRESIDGESAMSGSATTVRWLLAQGLLDELRLLVHPIVVGHGKRLFDGGDQIPLTLADSKTFSTGVLALTYQRA